LLPSGDGKWKLNLREGPPIQVRLRGRDVLARPEFINDVFADLLEALPWRVQMSIEDLTMHWQTVTLYRAGSRCSWRPHLEPPGT
jgi:hypothetical protein